MQIRSYSIFTMGSPGSLDQMEVVRVMLQMQCAGYWVSRVQKRLRGASMQDVIFAGTENRKPLSYAYVAITMDNSDHQLAIDFEEVTVSRRVYRSGE